MISRLIAVEKRLKHNRKTSHAARRKTGSAGTKQDNGQGLKAAVAAVAAGSTQKDKALSKVGIAGENGSGRRENEKKE